MISLDEFERDYASARDTYTLDIPDHFNFAFDVLDARARDADKDALLAIDVAAGTRRAVRYSELADTSARFAQALMALGLERGDAA